MALTFPKNPVLNQVYDYAPFRYQWDGQAWLTVGRGADTISESIKAHEQAAGVHGINSVTGLQSALDGKVPKTGGTISNVRREGQSYGSLVANVSKPFPGSGASSEAGTYNSIVVKLLTGWSNTMVRFRLIIRDYSNCLRNVDINFSGYAFEQNFDWWTQVSQASAVGSGAGDWQVWTAKSSNGEPVIYFHNPSGVDDYCTVEIVDEVSRGTQPEFEITSANGFAGNRVTVDRHYHSRNLVGPVVVSNGVNLGAGIEYGGNANGSYTKFPDGTITCVLWGQMPATPLSQNYSISPNLPHSMTSGNVTWSVNSTNSGSLIAAGALYTNGVIAQMNGTNNVRLFGYTYIYPINDPCDLRITVHGRWY